MLVATKPCYSLRLDLRDHTKMDEDSPVTSGEDKNTTVGSATGTSDGDGSNRGDKSYHLQASHATLVLMQTELQRASAELASAHSRRLTKYIA